MEYGLNGGQSALKRGCRGMASSAARVRSTATRVGWHPGIIRLRKRGAAETIWEQMDRLKKINVMLKRSCVTMQDAIDARLNPREYIHCIIKESRIDEAK